jgi:alcohol dehydrogenase class IV
VLVPHSLPRTITLRQPGALTFGAGCAKDAVDWLLTRQPRGVLVVHSSSATASVAPLVERLQASGVTVVVINRVPAEPDVASFEQLRTGIRGAKVDAVLAIGGGSVLDIAKLLAALHDSTVSVRDYFGNGLLPSRPPALVCLPTTAGTGSEVSPNAILYDDADQLKKAVISPHLVPDAVFVDPQLTVSVPPALTAATGIDALSHCLEAYANRAAHPLVDLYALQGIRLIAAHLKRSVDQPDDLDARSALALGSVYGGLCLGPVNTAAVHALAYPLGSEFRLAHGLSIALLLPHVVRFNLPAAPGRYADIARALGVADGADSVATATRGAERLASLGAECGIPSGLAACGVPANAIPRMAASAMKVTRLLKNNPRDVTLADAEEIYRLAL